MARWCAGLEEVQNCRGCGNKVINEYLLQIPFELSVKSVAFLLQAEGSRFDTQSEHMCGDLVIKILL